MADEDDPFESLLFLEERSFEDGHKEGFDKGKLKGLHEGWSLGVQKGTEISSEIGYYHGFVAAWLVLVKKSISTKPRAIKSLESLLSMLNSFPLTDPLYDKLLEDLSKIRAKLKQVCSLLGVQTQYEATAGISF